ncbi:MAG: DUF4197 domain-containing protein [Bacteroidetes bacterium]|nr:DUF4197 domain-containing protein [Bacteroidota bacterium]
MKKIIPILALMVTISLTACDTLLKVAEETVYGNPDPTNSEIISGLKEALANGAANAVTTLSQTGGYSNDPLVKIPFPKEAEFAATKLRDIGLGQLVDDFVGLLNEGAENGAKMALPIFKDAITSMTFADAKNILLGPENAATIYFQDKTQTKLQAAFSPHIKTSLDKVNATKIWTDITTTYNKIPFTQNKVDTDIVNYATGKALDGLFLKLANEEKLIRQDPIARTSDLLKKVFSYAERQKGN